MGRHGPFTLAVCAEMVFSDMPIGERLRHLHGLGFQTEIWDWSRHDLGELEAAVSDGVVIGGMTGYLRGTLADPEGARELLATAKESIALPVVAEIQVADVPGRCEPGTGEINYPAVARALAEAGYTGVVAMEAHAEGDPTQAVEAFRAAFKV